MPRGKKDDLVRALWEGGRKDLPPKTPAPSLRTAYPVDWIAERDGTFRLRPGGEVWEAPTPEHPLATPPGVRGALDAEKMAGEVMFRLRTWSAKPKDDWTEATEKSFEERTQKMILSFGKHAGKELSDVPRDYLEWMVSKCKTDLATYQGELDRRDSQEAATQTDLERLVQAGYRELAKKAHPDAGGSKESFLALQGAYEQLKVVLRELKEIK